MLGSLGGGTGDHSARRRSAAIRFVVALSVGNSVLVLMLLVANARISPVSASASAAVVAAAAVPAVLQAAGMRPLQSPWQVPESWRRRVDPEILPILYGMLLGPGLLNAVTLSAFWVLLFGSLVLPVPVVIAGWLCYAAVRATRFYRLLAFADDAGDRNWRGREASVLSAGLSMAFAVLVLL